MRLKNGERVQQRYANDMRKIIPYGIQTDEQGRYLVTLNESNGLSKAYFADKTGARVRICTTTYHRWIEEGKAVAVSDEALPRRNKKQPYLYRKGDSYL